MQVDIRDTIMDIMTIKSLDIRDYFNKYKIERKFLEILGDSSIDTVSDNVIYRCNELSPASKDYISIKLNLIRVLLKNMDRTEKMWNIYINHMDQKNLELRDMIRNVVGEVKKSKLEHNSALELDESLENLSVYNLKALNIPSHYIKYAKNNQIETFKDVRADINFIENYNNEYISSMFQLSLEDFILSVLKKDERSYKMVVMYENGMTLENIGDRFGLSKERVRQIIAKSRYTVTELFSDGVSDKDIVDLDEYSELLQSMLLDDTKTSLLNYFISDDSLRVKFLELEDLIKLSMEDSIWIDSLRVSIKEDIDRLNLSNYISVDIIFNKLKNNENFRVSKHAIVSIKEISGSVSNIRVEVIKHFYPDGIFISQKNIDNVVNLTNEITGKNKDNSSYFLKNSITSICVIRDKNTYIHPDLIDINENLIDKIKDYAIERPGVELFYGTIFRFFEDELKRNGIDNEYFLHGVMDKYLSDILEIKARSYYVKGYETKKIFELIEEISYNEKRKVSLDELSDYIDRDCYKSLLNKANALDYILTYSNNEFYSYRNIVLTDSDIEKLRKVINDTILYGRLDCDDLYKSMSNDEELKTILEVNKIDSGRSLKSLVRRVFKSEFDGVPANNTLISLKN